MRHLIEFRVDTTIPLEVAGAATTVQIWAGMQRPATVCCYVVYRQDRYIEVGDVQVKEGLLRALPCSYFMFIDRLRR